MKLDLGWFVVVKPFVTILYQLYVVVTDGSFCCESHLPEIHFLLQTAWEHSCTSSTNERVLT